MKITFFVVLGFFTGLFFVANAAAATWESNFDVKFGGYVKLDYVHQDASSGVNSGAMGTVGPLPSSTAEKNNQTILTARESRLNLTVTGPDYLGAKTRAFIEGDFYGSGTDNTTGNFRIRHAYLNLAWENTEIMAGQYWDLFCPMIVSTLDFGDGANIGAPAYAPRVPQIRLTQTLYRNEGNKLNFKLALQDPVQEYDENPVPNMVGQLELTSNALGVSPSYWGIRMLPLTVTLSGEYGRASVNSSADSEKIDSWGAGIYVHVPILRSGDGKSRAGSLSFEGQTYFAQAMDWNSATASRTIGTPGVNLEAAKGYGAIGQFIFYPTQTIGITAGYGCRGVVDSSNYTDKRVSGTVSKENNGLFINVAKDIRNVRLAVEYERLEAKYFNSSNDGTTNRYQISAIYFF